ncbi:alpha/beta fold hydrolase [Nocardia seriolae]|uniref:alpha/beta fold hydrolase n=1 Tax=Nocardia seriolae TaxID=37332 RepID=UPI000A10B7D9|nr:alpha/beta hydrolase [Nocardia seriolae]
MATVVMLHGIPGSATIWDAVRSRLGAHTTIAPMLRGFGGDAPPADPEEYLAAAQAECILRGLDRQGVGRFALVAHDFGGPVAAHLLARAPERVTHLAVFATNAFPDTPIPFPLSLVPVRGVGPLAQRILFSPWALRQLVRRGTGRPNPGLDPVPLVGDRTQAHAINYIFGESLRRIESLYVPVRDALAAVSVPALVGWGDRDPLFSVDVGRRTDDIIPGAQFRLYPDAGHFLPAERPAQLAADITALLGDS